MPRKKIDSKDIIGQLAAVKGMVRELRDAMPGHAAALRREIGECLDEAMADIGKLG